MAAGVAAAWVLAWGASASANVLSIATQSWGPMGDIQYPAGAHQPSCSTSGAPATGVPEPIFGDGRVAGVPTQQYAIGAMTPVSVPSGSTLVGGTLSGAVAAATVGGASAPAGPATFAAGFGFASSTAWGICPSMSPSVEVTVALPGGGPTPVPFTVDAYAMVQHMLQFWGSTGTDLALTSGPWMAPVAPLQLSVSFAFTPSRVAASSVPRGSGTQAAVTWSAGGNDASTTYEVQREAFDASGPVSTWQTVFQGTGTGFQTNDQVCGVAYVYRVAAVGADAATPWSDSPEWDEFPCTVQVVEATAHALSLAWSEVSAGAQPVMVWCAEGGPGGAISCAQSDMPLGSGTTSASLTGLQPNTEYAVWVCSATDMWGCPEVNAWTAPAPAGALVPGTSGAGLPEDAQPFTWSSGGNPAGTVYRLLRQVWSGSAWSAPEVVYSGTAAQATVPQSPGASYLYAVQASGQAASPDSAAVPIQVAGRPSLRVTGPQTAVVSWSPIAGMSGTWVGCSLTGSGLWTTEGTATGGATALSVSGLLPDSSYTCAIAATASNAGIAWRQTSSAAETDAVPPGAPSIAAATQTRLTVRWSSAGNPGATPYEVQLAGPSGTAPVDVVTTGDSANLSGLLTGTPYTAEVRAENPTGTWTQWVSAAAAAWTVPAEPAPTGSTSGLGWSAQGGRGEVVLTWASVPGATGYRVWVYDGASYEAFDAGSATTWDSSAARIFPPDAALYPEVAAGSQRPPVYVHNLGGLALRDSPVDLYCTVDIGCGVGDAYIFSVSAYDSSGDSAQFEVPGTASASSVALTLPLQTDPTTPSVDTFTLSAGTANGYALGPAVHALLTAGSGPSGVAAYALSNDGTTWVTRDVAGCSVGGVRSCPSSLSVDAPWTVSAGPGTKTVWAKVESAAGLWSPPDVATIYVAPDTVPPTVDVTLNGGAATTVSTDVYAYTTVTDPLAEQAALSFDARYSSDGGQTWTAWASEGMATGWTAAVAVPGGASGPRTVLEQVKDTDLNLGQGGATIDYVGAAGSAGPAPGQSRACAWPVGSTTVPARCVVDSQVNVPLRPPSRATQLRVSLDDVLWGPWQPVSATLLVDLGPTPGPHTVWVQYRDAFDVVTSEPPLFFVLDPGAPTVSASWAGGASATDAAAHATLLVQAADDVGLPASLALEVSENGAVLYTGPVEPSVPLTLSGSGFQLVGVEVTDIGGHATTTTLGIYVEQPSG